jgi:uncharacterized protein YjdB
MRQLVSLIIPALFIAACQDAAGVAEDRAAAVVVIPDQVSIAVGTSVSLTAAAYNARGAEIPPRIAWSSSAPAIASVTATGRVTGHAVGVADITASMDGRRAVVRVTVVLPPPE